LNLLVKRHWLGALFNCLGPFLFGSITQKNV
jgi:hypothetical protein